MMGISKRALLEDYYPQELPALMAEWAVLHTPPDKRDDWTEDMGVVDPHDFLAM